MSLGDICTQVGVSGSKAFGILEALQESSLVKRGKEGKGYSLGPGLVTLSRKVLDDLSPSRLAEPVLEMLTEASGSTSVFGLITGETVYVAARRESKGDVRIVMRIGHSMPLTYGAHGKAIVAFLPRSEQERILKSQDLHFHGNPSQLDRIRLTEELARGFREGFTCGLAKSAPAVTVVAAPVLGSAGVPVGVIEIFVLAPEEAAREFGPAVAEAGRTLSRRLGAEVNDENGSSSETLDR
jgi:DNA-binding IclR family transcriptional regulator